MTVTPVTGSWSPMILYPRRFVALQETVCQIRGIAPAQIPGAKISVCHGVGGMFAASATIIMSNEPP